MNCCYYRAKRKPVPRKNYTPQ